MRTKFFTIGVVCSIIQMLMAAVLFLGAALEWWVLCWIGGAVIVGTIIYQIVKIRCPYCGYSLAFVGKYWDGRCPSCGSEIK